ARSGSAGEHPGRVTRAPEALWNGQRRTAAVAGRTQVTTRPCVILQCSHHAERDDYTNAAESCKVVWFGNGMENWRDRSIRSHAPAAGPRAARTTDAEARRIVHRALVAEQFLLGRRAIGRPFRIGDRLAEAGLRFRGQDKL